MEKDPVRYKIENFRYKIENMNEYMRHNFELNEVY